MTRLLRGLIDAKSVSHKLLYSLALFLLASLFSPLLLQEILFWRDYSDFFRQINLCRAIHVGSLPVIQEGDRSRMWPEIQDQF